MSESIKPPCQRGLCAAAGENELLRRLCAVNYYVLPKVGGAGYLESQPCGLMATIELLGVALDAEETPLSELNKRVNRVLSDESVIVEDEGEL